jgi:S1-C subfamily serine protease
VHGDLLDVVLLVACALFAFSGYRQGFVVGALSFVGFIGGVLLGAHFSSPLASALHVHLNLAIFAIVVVFVCALLGQVVTAALGVAIRRRLTWRPVRLADSAGGAVVSVLSVLLVAWLVGTALAHSSLRTLAREVRNSAILTGINDVMPGSALGWFASFRHLVGQYDFPQVFGALGPGNVVPVGPPDPALANSPAVRTDARSIVKVVGVAPSCSRRLEGSGFLYAPEHVLTNAHVVAGVTSLRVFANEGATGLSAQVVLYDPHRDVAVLYVPGLNAPDLGFAGSATPGVNAIVVGYPENGPFTPVAARVRGQEQVQGPDIYDDAVVTRSVYDIRAVVRPGNSGGPLLSTTGQVYGMVFAAASDNPDTGYALTAAEVHPDAQAGANAIRPVSTQTCTA